MKKRVWVILVVLCLALALVLSMAACNGVVDKLKDIAGNDTTDDSGKTSTGDKSGTDGSAGFEDESAAAVSALESMRQGNGYLIRYNVSEMENSEATTVAVGAKGNVYYVASGTHEYYYDVSGTDSIVYYDRVNAESAWEKNEMRYGAAYTREDALENMHAFIGTHSVWMTYYSSFVSSMRDATKSTATVVGRTCDKYYFSAAALIGEGLKTVRANYSCYVDKATSVCLKWEYSATVDGETETWMMECTEFNTNPTFVLPTVGGTNGGDDNGQGSQGGSEGQGGQGGSEGQGSQGGSEQGQDTTETILTYYPNVADASLVDGLLRGGFRATYVIGASVDANGNVDSTGALSEYTFAAKGDLYYIVSNGSQAYFDFGQSAEYYVDYRLRDGSWTKSNVYYGEDTFYTSAEQAKTDLRGTIGIYMTLGNESAVNGFAKSRTTYMDRSVDRFTKSAVSGGASETYDIRIDVRTGASIFFYYSIAGYGTVSRIATEYVVGYDVVLPTVQENTAVTIADLHDPDQIDVFASIREKAFDGGISITLCKYYDGSKVTYQLDWLGDSIQYVQTEETLGTYDTVYYYHYLIDLANPTVNVFQFVNFETGYEDEFGSSWWLETYDADEYNYAQMEELFYVLSNYSAHAYTPSGYERKVDNYTYDQPRTVDQYNIEGDVLVIDVDTDALLYLKYDGDEQAYIECEEIRYNPTNVDIAFPTPVRE